MGNQGDQNDFIERGQNYSVASEEKKQKDKDKGWNDLTVTSSESLVKPLLWYDT